MIKIVTFPKLLPMSFYVNLYIDENVLTLWQVLKVPLSYPSVSYREKERNGNIDKYEKKYFCSLLHNIYYK